jgi:cytidyltransferase-like protein
MVAVLSGRWQPPHNGHIWLVKQVLGRADEMVLGIVNPDPDNPSHPDFHKFHPADNPLTYWERHALWSEILLTEGVLARVSIVPMWHPRVSILREENYLPPRRQRFWVVPIVNTEEWTKVYDFQNRGEEVRVIPEEEVPSDLIRNHAVSIRKMIANGDDGWKKLVPPCVVKHFDELNVMERFREESARALLRRKVRKL